MPNHVSSRFIVTGPQADLEEFKARHFPDNSVSDSQNGRHLDFETVIPMPACLDSEINPASSHSEEGMAMVLLRAEQGPPYAPGLLNSWQIARLCTELGLPENVRMDDLAEAYLTKYPERAELGKARLRAVVETGYSTWYQWAPVHWGTKWNSYFFGWKRELADLLEWTMQTAWAFPLPVITRLSEMWPALVIRADCHDEGDNFAGTGVFRGGVAEYEEYDSKQPQFAEIYHRVHGRTIAERDAENAALDAEYEAKYAAGAE